jgi:hypothetical protein
MLNLAVGNELNEAAIVVASFGVRRAIKIRVASLANAQNAS